jgi:hypothetical protein
MKYLTNFSSSFPKFLANLRMKRKPKVHAANRHQYRGTNVTAPYPSKSPTLTNGDCVAPSPVKDLSRLFEASMDVVQKSPATDVLAFEPIGQSHSHSNPSSFRRSYHELAPSNPSVSSVCKIENESMKIEDVSFSSRKTKVDHLPSRNGPNSVALVDDTNIFTQTRAGIDSTQDSKQTFDSATLVINRDNSQSTSVHVPVDAYQPQRSQGFLDRTISNLSAGLMPRQVSSRADSRWIAATRVRRKRTDRLRSSFAQMTQLASRVVPLLDDEIFNELTEQIVIQQQQSLKFEESSEKDSISRHLPYSHVGILGPRNATNDQIIEDREEESSAIGRNLFRSQTVVTDLDL